MAEQTLDSAGPSTSSSHDGGKKRPPLVLYGIILAKDWMRKETQTQLNYRNLCASSAREL